MIFPWFGLSSLKDFDLNMLSDPSIIAACAGLALVVAFIVFMVVDKEPKPFLQQQSRNQIVRVPLIFRENVSHDTVRFRFGLPSKNMRLGLPVGACLKFFCPNTTGVVAGEWNGREDPEKDMAEVERKYTPTPSVTTKGYFDLVLKVYEGGVLPQFKDGGKMSQHMNKLKVGDTMPMSGPWGQIEYTAPGTFVYMKKELKKKHIGMIAGGTGITPMLQVIDAVLTNPKDSTTLSLIYANKTEEDILVRDMLEELANQFGPKRFKLHYTLDQPPAHWAGSKGFVTQEMIKAHLPRPGSDTIVLMCGPPPMVKFACRANLDALGYAKQDQLAF